MTWLILSIAGYLSGSVLYSKLIAKYVLRQDIGTTGDGNPGATNVAKLGGAKWAIVAFALDVLKAAVPVAIAHFGYGLTDWRLMIVGVAPAIGHAYPLFSGFRGGKAIAAIAGAWVGIALWELITVGGLLLLFWYKVIEQSAWVTIFMLLTVGAYLLARSAPLYWFAFWGVSLLFLTWTHRKELNQRPTLNAKLRSQLWH